MNTPLPTPDTKERERELMRRVRRMEEELDALAADRAGSNLRLAAMFLMGISTGVCLTLLILDVFVK